MRPNLLSVLHIEDDPLWSNAVKLMVTSLPERVDYRGAASLAEGRRLARDQQPEVVLLDLRLPDGDGFGLVEELAGIARSRIVVLSARRDEVALLRVMRQPQLAGLVWKTAGLNEQLPAAIAAVRSGCKFYSPEVRDAMRRLRADSRAFFKILSDREMALLPGLGRGLTDDELAGQAGLSALTIKSHRQHIMAKLDLHRTPDLIYWAIAHGFVEAGTERAFCRGDRSSFSFPVFGGDAPLPGKGSARKLAGAEAPPTVSSHQPRSPGLPGNNHEYTK